MKKKAAARGYGYVAVSRFKSRAGCYLYGKLRRSDFLPVGKEKDDEALERGYDSVSSEDEEGRGLEYAFEDRSDASSESDAGAEGVLERCDIDFL